MPVPFIAVAIAASAAISAVQALYNAYSTKKSTEAQDNALRYQADYANSFADNTALYASDYISRHHLQGRTIKYPYVTNMVANYSGYQSAVARLYANDRARRASYYNAGFSGTRSALNGYSGYTWYRQSTYRPTNNYNNVPPIYG